MRNRVFPSPDARRNYQSRVGRKLPISIQPTTPARVGHAAPPCSLALVVPRRRVRAGPVAPHSLDHDPPPRRTRLTAPPRWLQSHAVHDRPRTRPPWRGGDGRGTAALVVRAACSHRRPGRSLPHRLQEPSAQAVLAVSTWRTIVAQTAWVCTGRAAVAQAALRDEIRVPW